MGDLYRTEIDNCCNHSDEECTLLLESTFRPPLLFLSSLTLFFFKVNYSQYLCSSEIDTCHNTSNEECTLTCSWIDFSATTSALAFPHSSFFFKVNYGQYLCSSETDTCYNSTSNARLPLPELIFGHFLFSRLPHPSISRFIFMVSMLVVISGQT